MRVRYVARLMPKDRFYDYLEHCEKISPISPGDYIELVCDRTTLAWTRLVRDLIDTCNAGRLEKIKTPNGGIAYVRSTQK